MKYFFAIFALFSALLLWAPAVTAATSTPNSLSQQAPDQYMRGRVVRVLKEGYTPNEDHLPTQTVDVHLTNGTDANKTVRIEYSAVDQKIKNQKVVAGDDVVVIKVPGATPETSIYYITDFYRVPSLALFGLVFVIVVIAFGRLRGISSLFGLAATVGVLVLFIIPQILAGHSPIITTMLGAPLIILLSMYLAHGWTRQTHLSIVGTVVTLVFAVLTAVAAVSVGRLFGTGSEEAMYVATSSPYPIDLRGILLAGVIIGALGVLDDVTTAQTAAVHEIHDTKPSIKFPELFMRVMRVGREHIASLVNTLVLAYAGASFPLFLLFYTTKEQQPLWVVLNSQQISEEIVRTLIGSVTLILAVPISSAISAWWYTKQAK